MLNKQRLLKKGAFLIIPFFLLTGCGSKTPPAEQAELEKNAIKISGDLTFEVNPESFSLVVKNGESSAAASLPGQSKKIENYTEAQGKISWDYPSEQLSVSLEQEENYLHVSVASTSEEDNQFIWPHVSGQTYYLPLGEGKRIPHDDPIWNHYLRENEISVMEQLSMPFFISASGDTALLYILEQPFRSSLRFLEEDETCFSLYHEYPSIDPERTQGFRIYLIPNDPAEAAKIYKSYVMEQGAFATLEEKAEINPDIRKLYGAPHIYLWGERIITPEDINWPAFRASLNSGILQYIRKQSEQPAIETNLDELFRQLEAQDYVDTYQKNSICQALSILLSQESFYTPQLFPNRSSFMDALIPKDADYSPALLNQSEQIQWNKHALAANLPDVFRPADTWMEEGTTNLIEDLKDSGIQTAWIGLNSWEQAYAKPELVTKAIEKGYLIGPYDSYHSIHEPGKEQWITAKFDDATLYETATIQDKEGKKISGFQNTGRKLNPALSFPAVENRVEQIQSAIPFNSWFIDCDATGEIYDDYSPSHTATQQEDLSARLARMAYIRDHYNVIIGSEGGHDFAASTIAFAHGIELKSFSWMDPDMGKNKESEYYIGNYYNPAGGAAERFTKQVPLKETYYHLFLNPAFDVPLYKLVYNDSVITSYHWDWSTFKIKNAVNDRMLRELLYNTPPLYHLDKEQWEKLKPAITAHTKIWSDFSRKAILEEMTGFSYLTENGLVQKTAYGASLTVTANYSNTPYRAETVEIPPHSLLISDAGAQTLYTPQN